VIIVALDNKFFVFNREATYEEGKLKNISFTNEEYVSLINDRESGIIFSKILDSGDDNTIWHKFEADIDGDGYFISTHVFVSDSEKVLINGSQWLISEILNNDAYSKEEIIDLLTSYLDYEVFKGEKFLLHKLKGRYLFFITEIQTLQTTKILLKNIKIHFPLESFIKYFPRVYQSTKNDTDFFLRFISIFQDLYIEIENEIDLKYLEYLPEKISKNRLVKILEMMGLEYMAAYPEDVLRRVLIRGKEILKAKGSRKGIRLLINTLTDKDSKLIENYSLAEGNYTLDQKKGLIENFGEDRSSFTILVNDSLAMTMDEKEKLIEVLDSYVPVKTNYKIYFVENFDSLNYYQPIIDQIRKNHVVLGEKSRIPLKI
jgi:phage tail-like protein